VFRGKNGVSVNDASVLSVSAASFSSPAGQSNLEQHQKRQELDVKPMVVGTKSTLEPRNGHGPIVSISPPPQAMNLEWSTFFATKAAPRGQSARRRRQYESPSPSPPPPPPPHDDAPLTLQEAANMKKIVEMHTLLCSQDESPGELHGAKSIYTLAASLRKLRGDWMLGVWIQCITQASLAFHLWRQRCLSLRAAGLLFCENISTCRWSRFGVLICSVLTRLCTFNPFYFSSGPKIDRAEHTITFAIHTGHQHD
jgi:hypothetical protein